MGIKVSIGDHEFATKKEAKLAIQHAMRKPWNRRLEGYDEEIARGVLARHPDAAEIVARGIDHFEVRQTRPPGPWGQGGWAFHAIFTDGTYKHYTYVYAITPPSLRKDVLTVMRDAVRDQTVAFRKAELKYEQSCRGCETLLNLQNCDVDHMDPEFAELADTFLLVMFDRDYSKVDFATHDTGFGYQMAPGEIRSTWERYHFAKARLQLLCKPCHRAKKGNALND